MLELDVEKQIQKRFTTYFKNRKGQEACIDDNRGT